VNFPFVVEPNKHVTLPLVVARMLQTTA